MAIRPISADRTVQVVWYGDPAVDQEKSAPYADYLDAAYKSPSCWREMLKFKDGQKPTVFSVGVISPGELATIEDECGVGTAKRSPSRLFWLCFLHSVRDISEMPGVEKAKNGVADLEYVKSDWLARTFIGPNRDCARFVGSVAYRWNQMTEEEEKN